MAHTDDEFGPDSIFSKFNTVKLQIGRFAQEVAISQRIFEFQPAEITVEHLRRLFLVNLKAKVFYEELDVIRFPTHWWDAFKERWFPSWLIQKFPINYTEFHINAYYARISIPERYHEVHIPRMSNLGADFWAKDNRMNLED